MQEEVRVSRRIEVIDLARGVALAAMAVYHFSWDLEFFGYAPPGMTAEAGWKLFARSIASSFLFLVGVSLFLAHGKKIRWRSFLRRLAMIAAAALAISIATYLATPERFIFFGILHQIALASLLGLTFLTLPAAATLAVAAVFVAAPHFLRSPLFDHPAWWWTGLSSVKPLSNDYVPLFPWFGAVLFGIAAASLAYGAGLFDRLRHMKLGSWSAPLQFAGRHSLAVYLVHQPVLIGLLWIFAQVAPPTGETREVAFLHSCQSQCVPGRDAEFCLRYCACVLDTLEADGRLDAVFEASQDAQTQADIETVAAQCTASAAEGDTQ